MHGIFNEVTSFYPLYLHLAMACASCYYEAGWPINNQVSAATKAIDGFFLFLFIYFFSLKTSEDPNIRSKKSESESSSLNLLSES